MTVGGNPESIGYGVLFCFRQLWKQEHDTWTISPYFSKKHENGVTEEERWGAV